MPLREPTLGHVTDITSAEVGGFIHVDPQAVIGHHLMEGLKLLAPVLHTLLAEKVWKMCYSRPYLHAQAQLHGAKDVSSA